MTRAVGIDLGTTYSAVAAVQAGEPVIVPSPEGGRLVPSIVAVGRTGERLIGEMAKRQRMLNPEDTIYSVKRLMGCRFTDQSVQTDSKRLPYRLTEGANGDVRVIMGGRLYSPPEISAMILRKLKRAADDYLGEEVTDAVVTVPAYFNDSQRQATRDAGTIAGLNVLRICSEPTAAALAYGMHKEQGTTIAVYDLGGGTFDISILEAGGGTFHVKSSSGDTHLGGDDFDERIVDWLCKQFAEETGIDLRQYVTAMQRVRDAAEKAKHELSSLEETEINLPYVVTDEAGAKHLVITLTRGQFESMILDLIKQTLRCCRQALADARLTAGDISEVLLVGGSSRIPRVQEEVQEFFGREPRKGIDPDEAIALGAAIQAGMLSRELDDVVLSDVTPLTLGIRTVGGIATPIIPRSTPIPVSKTRTFSTAADMQRSIEVLVYQGERELFDENTMLGCFTLTGIPPAPAGEVKIDVTFNIDADGILNVTARDKSTGNEKELTISASSGLSREEVEQAARDLEVRDSASLLLHRAEKILQGLDDGAGQLKQRIEGDIASLRSALQGQDLLSITSAVQQLGDSLQPAAVAACHQSAPGRSEGNQPPG